MFTGILQRGAEVVQTVLPKSLSFARRCLHGAASWKEGGGLGSQFVHQELAVAPVLPLDIGKLTIN